MQKKDARADDSWSKVWGRVQTIGESVGVVITKPRVTANQHHRANAGNADQTSEDYYRINVYYPFIDRVVEEIECTLIIKLLVLVAANRILGKLKDA